MKEVSFMKIKRFSVFLIVLLFLVGSLTIPAPTLAKKAAFKDVNKNHYAYDSIQWAYDVELVGGFPDGTFRPNQPITEQQFGQILVKFFELEPTSNKLTKYTTKALASDPFYNTLAAYKVPLNGYFDNNIRGQAIKRGVVAQALTHVLDGQATLKDSIQFLLDHHITSGQYPQYENTDLIKFFGSSNQLTRAQVVTLFHNLQRKSFFYISEDALNSFENNDALPLNTRANAARNILASSLRIGKDWSPISNTKDSWNGDYSYFYRYGRGETDSIGRYVTITGSTKTEFYVTYDAFDGEDEGFVQGYATILSPTKAMMTETVEGNRCVIEFQKQSSTALKTIEHDCKNMRDAGTNYSGVLKK